jgi:hypothetical protein
MSDLFCTPKQGKRLKELLPELNYGHEWSKLASDTEWCDWPKRNGDFMRGYGIDIAPALTLQELRDVAKEHINEWESAIFMSKYIERLSHDTAPELADWVIERLEESK